MKASTTGVRLALLLAVAAVALVLMWGDTEADANTALWSSGPLLACPDVNGDGEITMVGDILKVAGAFGKFGDGNYQYIYDVGNGDGVITVVSDILPLALRFGDSCTDLIDQQVALATQATAQYQDCQDAVADGYEALSQYVPSMGIHLWKSENLSLYPEFYSGDLANSNDLLRHPVGLLCSDSNPDPNKDVPDRLIGLWYLDPVQVMCDQFGVAGPCEDEGVQPVGFGTSNTDEDNQWVNEIQQTWHLHTGTCAWLVLGQPLLGEGFDQFTCEVTLAGTWFSTYGWMVHLYNFIPNPSGRFTIWNLNVPNEGQ